MRMIQQTDNPGLPGKFTVMDFSYIFGDCLSLLLESLAPKILGADSIHNDLHDVIPEMRAVLNTASIFARPPINGSLYDIVDRASAYAGDFTPLKGAAIAVLAGCA